MQRFALVTLTVLMTFIAPVTLNPMTQEEVPVTANDSAVSGDTDREPSFAEQFERLRNELRADFQKELSYRLSQAGNPHSFFQPPYSPPYQVHYYHHNGYAKPPVRYRPAPDQPMADYTPEDEEDLSALRQQLKATESRLQAAEYRLEATEYDLKTTKSRLQELLENRREVDVDLPQATEGRSRTCEDKLAIAHKQLRTALNKLELLDQAVLATESSNGTGSTFIRWGRTECPLGTQLVYEGITGGSWFEHQGAASNRQCLTLEPEFDDTAPTANKQYLYGAEYQEIPGHHDHDVPCAVCLAPQSSSIMIPVKLTCPEGWVMQYNGHLLAGFHNHAGASEFLCVDAEPEDRPGGHENKNGVLLYNTVTQCGSLPCPPYEANKVVTCVVCSK